MQALLLAQYQVQTLLLAQLAVGIVVTVSQMSVLIFGSVGDYDIHTEPVCSDGHVCLCRCPLLRIFPGQGHKKRNETA